jgi:hypothetical protein
VRSSTPRCCPAVPGPPARCCGKAMPGRTGCRSSRTPLWTSARRCGTWSPTS